MLYISLILSLFALLSFASFLKLEEQTKKVLFFACWVACVAIAGFREVGCDRDSLTYLTAFNGGNAGIAMEKSFYLITALVKFCFAGDFLFLLFIYAAIGVSTKFLAIQQLTPLWMLSGAIYVANFFILQDMTQIRIGVATGMLLLCIKPLYDRNWKLFLVFSALGVFFHMSAALILPLWLLGSKSFNKPLYIGLIIMGYVLFFLQFSLTELMEYIPIDYIQKKLEFNQQYAIDNKAIITPFTIMQSLKLVVASLFIWKYGKIEKENRYLPLILKIYILSIVSFVLFSSFPVFSLRISEFFGCVEIILIPMLIYAFKDQKMGMVLPLGIGVFFLCMSLFFHQLISF